MKTSTIIAFIFGTAFGAFVAWKIAKDKYQQVNDAEEEDHEFKIIPPNVDDPEPKEVVTDNDGTTKKPESISYDDIMKKDYSEILKTHNYKPRPEEESEEDKPLDKKKPYVITPEEFEENEDYEKESIVYYANDVFVTVFGEVIYDIENTVGEDSIKHFGEYEADTVFVRNDALKTDYEILRDATDYENE